MIGLTATHLFVSMVIALCLMFIAIGLGFNEIKNKLKYLLLKNKGYDYFGFMQPSGRVAEAVLKRDKEIKWRKGSYFYNQKQAYKYDKGGNLFIEGKPNPTNIDSIFTNAENASMGQDSKSLTALLKRVYNLGKLANENAKEKLKEYLLYASAGGAVGSVLLLFELKGKVDLLISAVG